MEVYSKVQLLTKIVNYVYTSYIMSQEILTAMPELLKDDWKNSGVQKMVHNVLTPEQPDERFSVQEQIRWLRQRRNRDLNLLYRKIQASNPEMVEMFEGINKSVADTKVKQATKRNIAYEFATNDPEVRATYAQYQNLEDSVRRGVYSVLPFMQSESGEEVRLDARALKKPNSPTSLSHKSPFSAVSLPEISGHFHPPLRL